MSDKMQGGILAGSTSVSVPVILRKTADNTELTAIAAAGVTAAYYWRQGGTPTALTALSDLAAITSAFSAGGWKEADATHQPGVYRLDVDNAAFATGADWVIIGVKVASAYVFYEKYALTTNVVQAGDSFARIGVAGVGLTNLGDTRIANLDTTVSSRSTYAGGAVASVTGNVGGSVGSVTAAVTVGTINAGVITASSIAAGALNGKGDWLVSSSYPANFGSLSITAGGIVKADLQTILTTALSETVSGNLAAAYKKFFDVSAPVLTTANVNQTGDSYAALTGVTVEPTSPPSSTASILDKIKWLFSLGKNKRTQTGTTELVRNDADSATIGTATKSDDGTTFTRGKFS